MSEESDPITTGFAPAPSARRHRDRLLLWCIAGSAVLHVLLIAVLPPFAGESAAPPVQVLDVVLVKAEPPAPLPVVESRPAKPPKAQRAVPVVPEQRPAPASSTKPLPEPEPAAARAPVAPTVPAPSEPVVQPVPPGAGPSAPEAAPRMQQQQASAPAPVAPPRFDAAYLQNPPPRYPLVARRRGEEGTVTLRVHVRRDGVPASVGPEKSSGSSALDNAALEAVRAWRFAPARQGEEAVDAWVLVPIVFRLEGAS